MFNACIESSLEILYNLIFKEKKDNSKHQKEVKNSSNSSKKMYYELKTVFNIIELIAINLY